jgi:hypothetical protein
MPCVPKTFLRRDSLGYPGDASKVFLTLQFSGHAIRVQFLKDVGLIRSRCSLILAVAIVPATLILAYFFPQGATANLLQRQRLEMVLGHLYHIMHYKIHY